MGYFQMPHSDWLESAGMKCSPFGREVAYIIGCTFGGIYNAPIKHETIEWANEHFIEVVILHDLASWDMNRLTNLTLFAHEMCIRISISAVVDFSEWDDEAEEPKSLGTVNMSDDIPEGAEWCHPKLSIMFHKRNSRAGGMSDRHPTIEQAIDRFRAAYCHPDEILKSLAQAEGEE